MKFAISTAALLLVLGTTASVYAGQDKGKEEEKPQAEHSQQAKPAARQAEPAKQTQEAKPASQQRQNRPADQQQTRSAKPAQQQSTQHAASTQRSQSQAVNHTQPRNNANSQARVQQTHGANGNGGGSHGRISDDHYASNFGSGHRFHVSRGDFDNRRFEYGGYSFGFIDPWPGVWGYSDDVYVVFVDGGYYMYDPIHPGMRISINIL